MNPYQQNIDIVKGFFNRKIILLYSIFTILPIFAVVFFDANDFINTVEGIAGGNAINSASGSLNPAGTITSVYSLFVFEILLAVVFLLFFVKSGSSDGSLKAPIGMFRVVSVIELVITVLASLALVFAVLFTSLYILENYSALVSVLAVPFMFASVPAAVLLVLAQTMFAGSIKESINSIYLKKRGAKLFGVMNCVAAVLCLYCAVLWSVCMTNYDSEMSYVFATDPLVIFLGLTAVKHIFGALVGLKYTKYIEGFSDSSTTREEIIEKDDAANIVVCKKCGNALTPDDYFCNHCGTPVEK